jgi:predicted RNA-binding protein with PIN domain
VTGRTSRRPLVRPDGRTKPTDANRAELHRADEALPAGAQLVVDGMNVIGSRPDGWWRDRPGAARRLLERLQALAAAHGDPITLVLEGPATRGLRAGPDHGVDLTYARRTGRDAGDDRIVELVADLPDPSTACVVTSDRALASRVTQLGATVRGAAWLLGRLDELPGEARDTPSGPTRT